MKKSYLVLLIVMLIFLTACSPKSPSDTEKLQELVGRENESWVSLVVLNNSSAEIDFSYFDVPENSVGIILAPGEKAGDDKNGESDIKAVVAKDINSIKYSILDNKSGKGWYFEVKPEDKAIIVTITDGDPYDLAFQYMDQSGQIFNY